MKTIQNGQQYDQALSRVYELMLTHPSPMSSVGLELAALVVAIDDYEATEYPISIRPEPVIAR
jgi:antitoxin component HigA of HigAB toxin-antitoxin module